MAKVTYKNKTEEIRALFEKFKKQSNAIYWTGILSVVSFIIMLFRENKTYTLGYSVNVILHKVLLDNLDKVFAYALSFLFVLILAVVFFFLSKEVKKGKFIPLIVTTSIYGLDAFSLFFTKGLYTTDWDYIVAIIVHVLVLGYLFYLIYLYNKIVNLSNENNKK